MNTTTYGLAFAVGVMALMTSCTATSNRSTQAQSSPKLTQISASQTATTVKIDGSSTVYPITKAVAEEFRSIKAGNKEQVTVNFSGTIGGFEKFCAGQTDISNASRPILTAEMEACNQNSVRAMKLKEKT